MQKSVLDLNREIKRLNIDPAATMGNNREIAKYNTLDVDVNKDLNGKIEEQELNVNITKAFDGLKQGKNNKETQIIKEIDDLIFEIDKFRTDTFDKTTQKDGKNIYDELQKKIKTVISQNTQTNYSFYLNKTQILNGPVKTKIGQLIESNNKLNSSFDFTEEKNKQAKDIKKNLTQIRRESETAQFTPF